MQANCAAALRALFDWRWPMRCHLTSMSAVWSIFCRASCTLFSPKSRCPACQAARTWSAPNVFETAMSWMAAGSRPARRAAASSRDRTTCRLCATDATVKTWALLDVRLEQLEVGLRFLGVRAVRRHLGVGLELLRRLRQLAGVQVDLAEHEVRLGVLGIGGDRGGEVLLRLRHVLGVPGDDPLVVERLGVAASGRARLGGGALGRFGAHFLRFLELLLRVVHRRQA